MSDPEPALPRDSFKAVREAGDPCVHRDGEERVPLILSHRAVREAARDWHTYSSNAPFRVPIPAEDEVRKIRQIPIELDPPRHTQFRKLLDPWFLRPVKPDYVARIDECVASALKTARDQGEVEVVSQLALPLQSAALAVLLGVPASHAAIWAAWGTSLYRDGDGAAKDRELERYLHDQFARAAAAPEADDFFAFLTRTRLDGRHLDEDELMGIANLTFAGGRDTVINAIAEITAHFAQAPCDAARVRADPKLAISAAEEFVRVTSPLAMIGRVCPAGAEVDGVQVEEGDRIGLCWASANHDAQVFDDPHALRIDRKPNPHMGFGMGPHACMGSAHARALMRSLIRQLAKLDPLPAVLSAETATDEVGGTTRRLGFEELLVRF